MIAIFLLVVVMAVILIGVIARAAVGGSRYRRSYYDREGGWYSDGIPPVMGPEMNHSAVIISQLDSAASPADPAAVPPPMDSDSGACRAGDSGDSGNSGAFDFNSMFDSSANSAFDSGSSSGGGGCDCGGSSSSDSGSSGGDCGSTSSGDSGC